MVGRIAAALFIAGLIGAGCVREPVAYPIVGPDGSPMLHVSCGADEGRCFQLAGQNCPSGYAVFPLHPPHSDTFLVQCRSGAPATYASLQTAPASSAPPAASHTTSTQVASVTTQQAATWPPNADTDTVSPWPTNAAAATSPGSTGALPASGKLPPEPARSVPASGLPGSPDDIGY